MTSWCDFLPETGSTIFRIAWLRSTFSFHSSLRPFVSYATTSGSAPSRETEKRNLSSCTGWLGSNRISTSTESVFRLPKEKVSASPFLISAALPSYPKPSQTIAFPFFAPAPFHWQTALRSAGIGAVAAFLSTRLNTGSLRGLKSIMRFHFPFSNEL